MDEFGAYGIDDIQLLFVISHLSQNSWNHFCYVINVVEHQREREYIHFTLKLYNHCYAAKNGIHFCKLNALIILQE